MRSIPATGTSHMAKPSPRDRLRWWDRVLIVLIFWALAFWIRWCPEARGQVPITAERMAFDTSTHYTVVLDVSMVSALDQLADTAQVEYFRCLLGIVRRDSVIIDVAWPPPGGSVGEENSVAGGPCPLSALGTWHNHTRWETPLWNPKGPREYVKDPRTMCYLSYQDEETARTDTEPLTMISVMNGIHCLWARLYVSPDSVRIAKVPLP